MITFGKSVTVMLSATKFPRAALTSSAVLKGLRNRTFSIASHEDLELQYEKVEASPKAGPVAGPLVICHGLLCVPRVPTIVISSMCNFCSQPVKYCFSGSKQNWRSLSKAFAARLGADVFSLVILHF